MFQFSRLEPPHFTDFFYLHHVLSAISVPCWANMSQMCKLLPSCKYINVIIYYNLLPSLFYTVGTAATSNLECLK